MWIVFYWSIGGVGSILYGLALAVGGGLIGGATQGLGGAFRSASVIAGELIGLGGLLLFHYGILMELACYGLWTFRSWALWLAKILAVTNVILSGLSVMVALVMRLGILTSLGQLVIAVAILVYLCGSSNLAERLRQAISRVGQVDGQTWERYE